MYTGAHIQKLLNINMHTHTDKHSKKGGGKKEMLTYTPISMCTHNHTHRDKQPHA